jgi:MATE family multidrug resistance protein
MLGLEVSAFSVTTFVLGGFGDAVLAGHQIALQSASMTFMIPLGIATATAVLVGQAAGRHDRRGVRRAGSLGIGLATVFMCLSALLFWLAPQVVIGLFVDLKAPQNLELVSNAVVFLGIAAMFQLVDGMQVTAQGALRGLKDTRVPMLLTLVAYWIVGIASGLVLTFVMGLGPRGMWFGLVAGLAVAAALLVQRFARLSSGATSDRWRTDAAE